MTREEAIKILKSKMDGNTDTSYEWAETVRMAINALEQERSRLAQITQYRNDCEKLMQENEQLKKALEQEPIDKSAMMHEIYMEGVNMSGEYQGCWVRFKDIEYVVDRYIGDKG